MKITFEQTIQCATVDSSLIALTFGSQSCLLEFDDGTISDEDKLNNLYNKQVKNLNDLVYVFKRMLTNQYNMFGYINITED